MHKLPTKIRIHQNGDLNLENITNTDINIVALDTSISKQKLYQEHLKYLNSECNKNSIILGLIFAATIGLISYTFQNLEVNGYARKNATTILPRINKTC